MKYADKIEETELRSRHTITLSPDARAAVRDLRERTGLPLSGVVECLIREIPIREARDVRPMGEE
jgi:hypothetical protein